MPDSFISAIKRHADLRPHQPALCDGDIALTYSALDAFSTAVALYLRGKGCASGDRVVMLASRRSVTVGALIGVMKLGCVHVPVDERMPTERLIYIIEDLDPALVIVGLDVEADVLGQISSRVATISAAELEALLDDLPGDGVEQDRGSDLPEPPPEVAAYCIYTSGSTGRPKGVAISHGSIAAFFEGVPALYDVDENAACLSFSHLHFDVFLMDMLFPLFQGARLRVYDDAIDPNLMFGIIREERITHFSAWGMMLGLIAEADEFDLIDLPFVRTILTGTDVPDVKVVQRWLARGRGIGIINAYGPTEATCAATGYLITQIEPDRQELYPIGKPLKNVRAILVDEHGRPINHAGIAGELLIGGPQVMLEYWRLPEETSARIAYIEGIRHYRTGDICAYVDDGDLRYIGRRDNEVNIGGYRVHLSEIQRVLNGFDSVSNNEIVLVDTSHGEKVLAAAVLLRSAIQRRCRSETRDQLTGQFRERLRRELPGYMVPRFIEIIPAFPLLSSGKPDRGKLRDMMQESILSADKANKEVCRA